MANRRVRIGVLGCGAIAQSQHLPNITARDDHWDLHAVCDVSGQLVQAVGNRFHVPQRFTDLQAFLQSDIEAVILCLADPKTDAAIAVAAAGKHALIEKPMCYTVEEADRIGAAFASSGTVALVGYMKQHEPGFQFAREQILAMPDVRFIQVNHLHPDNSLHMSDFRIARFSDVLPGIAQETTARREAAIARAIGPNVTETEHYAFGMLIGSLIHDIGCLRSIFGVPRRVVSADLWLNGRGFTTVLAYPNGVRCVATWVDLPDLWDFQESLEVYGSASRVIITFPTGFSRGLPTTIALQGSDGGIPWRKEIVRSRDPGFTFELEHFHQCITTGTQPLTTIEGARADAALVREIILTARRQREEA